MCPFPQLLCSHTAAPSNSAPAPTSVYMCINLPKKLAFLCLGFIKPVPLFVPLILLILTPVIWRRHSRHTPNCRWTCVHFADPSGFGGDWCPLSLACLATARARSSLTPWMGAPAIPRGPSLPRPTRLPPPPSTLASRDGAEVQVGLPSEHSQLF